jgi:hypothetical protein
MKASKLSQLLGNPGYIISHNHDCICVGSAYARDLISVDKKTLKVKYALDAFHKGRESLGNETLVEIWDTLHRLIETGEIQDIIEGKDIIENPLPVFTVFCGKLVESVTDEYGWPNVDDNGILMYNNTYFPTKKEAVDYGIEELSCQIEQLDRFIRKNEIELKGFKKERENTISSIEVLKAVKT